MENETIAFGTCKACKKAGQLFGNGFCESCQKGVEYIDDHKALRCDCGCVHFNLLKSGFIECSECQSRFGHWGVEPRDER